MIVRRLFLMVALVVISATAHAQEGVHDTTPGDIAPVIEQPASLSEPAVLPGPESGTSPPETLPPQVSDSFNADRYRSLIFTHWEHIALIDAKNSRGAVRPPSEEELTRDLETRKDLPKIKPPPEEREIRLGGIVFNGGKDWTIWLNQQRVTPDAVPEEVIDLQVYDEYIEMKWFDEWSNQIFPIRLRANQRFNIDSRIFLPG